MSIAVSSQLSVASEILFDITQTRITKGLKTLDHVELLC